ncbi:DUF3991 and TOPRIM domain-containing protein [Blautia sp.]|uniref:DUF3991 and TOPRIM domain-containing protein n=1 Tax=Blautia sp. TaxID=1955243 RepID=UPI00258A4E77|nr:DUF3991 and TOPRIM domain-containing protein [Blautia sp.]
MPGVTKEQIRRAKEWDLLSYLQTYEPRELKRCGGNEYRTVTHDSLKISNGKWHWHSRGIGGRTALDYLIKVRGMGFIPAVELLCGERGAAAWERPKPEPEERQQKPFSLPEENRCGKAMVSYLQNRGIDADIISQCIGKRILYESRRYQNCVFVGRDPAGIARYACLRGTHGDFKMDVDGSDKRYGFFLPASDKESSFLAVAESPIDALSVATLLKLQGEEFEKNHYLSLGGTAPRALLRFLRDHEAVTRISLCLDNDRAGLLGMEKIREAIREDTTLSRRIKVIADNPPPAAGGKDYNELLCRRAALRSVTRCEERA